MEVLAKTFQLWGSIWTHFWWIQVLQVSHWMEAWESRQAREHTPQGYFTVRGPPRGPGLVSTFPDTISSVKSQEVGDFEELRLRTRLFLMLKGEGE